MPTISQAELDRIKASVADEQPTQQENARRALKAISDARISSWPNTLSAQRKSKVDARENRKIEAEEQRRKVDQEEANLQRSLRVEAIKRANMLLYEQTDKMKFLRGQQLYTDVIADREDQVLFKKNKDKKKKEEEKKWHDDMILRLEEADRREKEEKDRRKAKSLSVSEIQQKQLLDSRRSLVEKLETSFLEGELIKKMAIDDLVEEQRSHAEKQQRARAQNADMLKANMNLKDVRNQILKEQEKEADKRKEQVDKMNEIARARYELERKHFNDKQRVREKLIEIATKDLESRKKVEDTLLEKAKAETEQKHQEEMARRAARKEKQMEAIDMSRKMQIQLRAERKALEAQSAAVLSEHWKIRNAEIEIELQEEKKHKHEKNMEVRMSQEAQVYENREKAAALKASELLRDDQTKAVVCEDDERFRDFAEKEIERFKAKGKKTFLLERAKEKADIVLISGKHK